MSTEVAVGGAGVLVKVGRRAMLILSAVDGGGEAGPEHRDFAEAFCG